MGARRHLLAILAILATTPLCVHAEDGVVMLPFANLTGRHEAFETITGALVTALEARGLELTDPSEIRPLLRRHRIRTMGMIGKDDARLLRAETGARFAVLGSLDIYRPEQSFEVNVSARVLDLETLELVTAISVGRIVQETESWFAIGRAESIEKVMQSVVDEVVTVLEPDLSLPRKRREQYHTCGLVAVVPLDDYSNSRYAAEIVQNLLMAELVEQDWALVEPGFVQEILLDAQRVARGGVSREVREILRNRLGVCWVLTGELESFVVSPGGQEAAVPSLEFGLRLVDARRPGLRATLDLARTGADAEGLFGTGREYSMARLARSCLDDVVEWMSERGDR